MRTEGVRQLAEGLARKHGLPVGEILDDVEQSIATVLTDRYGEAVTAYFTNKGNLEVWRDGGHNGGNGYTRLNPRRIRTQDPAIMGQIRAAVESGIRERVSLQAYEAFKVLRHTAVRGRIIRTQEDGQAYVDILVLGGFETCVGVIDLRNQPPQERWTYYPGQEYWFYVSKVLYVPDVINEGSAFRVVLSRTSRTLVEKVLWEHSRKHEIYTEIKCIRRIAGYMSHVKSRERLPKEAILKTSKEFGGERIVVLYG